MRSLLLGGAMLALANLSALAQVSDDVVKIGVLTDMGGVTADIGGKGSVIAAELALKYRLPLIPTYGVRQADGEGEAQQSEVELGRRRPPPDEAGGGDARAHRVVHAGIGEPFFQIVQGEGRQAGCGDEAPAVRGHRSRPPRRRPDVGS